MSASIEDEIVLDRVGRVIIVSLIVLFLLSLLGVFIVIRMFHVYQSPISIAGSTCVKYMLLIRGVYIDEVNGSLMMNITLYNKCPVNITITRIMLDNNVLSNKAIVLPYKSMIVLRYNITGIYDNTTTHRITVRYYWDQNYCKDEFFYLSPGEKP